MLESASDLAEARCRAYGLFAKLALDGVTADVWGHLDAVPALADAARPWQEQDGLRAAAAAHYEVLSHEVFPFQSVYLDPSAMPGGAESDRVSALYTRIGHQWDPGGPTPDHVGLLLHALAFLCGAEADAITDGHADVVRRVQRLQLEVLDEHLLKWWPAFAEALAWGRYPFYAEWADAVTELVTHHRGDLPPCEVSVDADPAPAIAQLDDGRTTLAAIAESLLVPTRVGAFLSRGVIRAVGRQQRLPGGFGARRLVLTNLMRSAATYGAFEAMIDELQVRFTGARVYYERLSESAVHGSAIDVARWVRACERTEAALADLRLRAREFVR